MCNRLLVVLCSLLLSVARLPGAAGLDGHDIVARLNARFSNGRPSNNLEEAGVVVHAFDGKEPGVDGWFATSDRWSASVINARVPYMYLGNPENDLHDLHAGIIISPDFAAKGLLCSYDHDGVTNALDPCALAIYDGATDCVPGCVGLRGDAPMAPRTVRQWCGRQWPLFNRSETSVLTDDIPVDDHCAWPSTALEDMMKQNEAFVEAGVWENSCTVGPRGCRVYNEIILNPSSLQYVLPAAIEALYFVTHPAALSPEHEKNGEEQAKAARRLFLKMYEMYKKPVPIVRFTSFSSQKPFELVSETSD